MAGRASQQHEGYLLHLRPYRESAALCDLFTLELGRVSAVAHGIRGRRGGSAPQPFNRYALALSGRGELKTLAGAEAHESRWLAGTALAAGLYLNELLVRLLPREDAHERLYAVYSATLESLSALPSAPQQEGPELEIALRGFERVLLEDLGYGVPFALDHEGVPIETSGRYRLEPAMGFVADDAGGFEGSTLLAIDAQVYADPAVRRAARRLFNAMLVPHLEGRAIQSRMLLARGGQPRSVQPPPSSAGGAEAPGNPEQSPGAN